MEIFDDERNYYPFQVAEKLEVHISTIYRMIKDIDDPLPAFKLRRNGRLKLNGRKLNKFIKEHEINTLEE